MQSLLFGISRNHGDQNIVIAGNRFMRELSDALGMEMKLSMVEDYDQLLAAVRSGAVAVAWMPPLLTLRASPAEATLVAVSERHGSLYYRSALVVANTSRFETIEQLRGAGVRVAWGDRYSAAQYFVPRHHLLDAGLLPGRDLLSERFLTSGFSICGAVANGEVELGAAHVNDDVVNDHERALQDLKRHFTAAPWRLRVIAVTDRIPADGVVVTRAVDDATQARIAEALHRLHAMERAKEAMKALMNADRLVPLSAALRSSYRRLEEMAALVGSHPPLGE